MRRDVADQEVWTGGQELLQKEAELGVLCYVHVPVRGGTFTTTTTTTTAELVLQKEDAVVERADGVDGGRLEGDGTHRLERVDEETLDVHDGFSGLADCGAAAQI